MAMRSELLTEFQLDDRLARDSVPVVSTGLCELRLSRDSRWPWLILVPRRPDITEIFELTPLDQALLAFETELVASTLKAMTGATKINIGALGNIVRQLHVHVIARSEGDANWPGPVWGFGTAVPYSDEDRNAIVTRLQEALCP
jgi:diadenosine tetraphosphate (Ap4A) HIT family hydrolase